MYHSNVVIVQNDSLVRLYKRGPRGKDGAVMIRSLNYVDVSVLMVLWSFCSGIRFSRPQFKISGQVSDGDEAAEKKAHGNAPTAWSALA